MRTPFALRTLPVQCITTDNPRLLGARLPTPRTARRDRCKDLTARRSRPLASRSTEISAPRPLGQWADSRGIPLLRLRDVHEANRPVDVGVYGKHLTRATTYGDDLQRRSLPDATGRMCAACHEHTPNRRAHFVSGERHGERRCVRGGPSPMVTRSIWLLAPGLSRHKKRGTLFTSLSE